MIYDGFIFFNELDLLEIRLNELNDVVDYFILVESKATHSGNPKKLYFEENKYKFKKFLNKIIHIIIDTSDKNLDPWARERIQRDSIANAWNKCKDNDIVCVSDVDEIPKAEKLAEYSRKKEFICLEQILYYYFINYSCDEIWRWFKLLPYSLAKNMTPCQIRYTPSNINIPESGWHFSYLGGIDKIIEKIESYAHTEYNNPEFKNKDRISKIINEGKDLFNRDLKFKINKIDYNYPKYILDNFDKFKNILIDQKLHQSQ